MSKDALTGARQPSLPEVYQSIPTEKAKGFWRKFFVFFGPGYLVAVGYMDPGNWATDLEGGAKFGYSLLSIILISNIMAVFLQHLSLKLGMVTGRDLAQNCRDNYPRSVNFILWILCEIAIIATDLAEILGSAIALNLLFGIPFIWGALITVADVVIILMLQNKGFRYVEAVVIVLILTIAVAFGLELYFAQPDLFDVALGLVPSTEIIKDPVMLYISIGILGATVMPHNLYLHSSIVLSRRWKNNFEDTKQAINFATLDSSIALLFALFINAAILILSAAVFHNSEHSGVAEIQDAYMLLSPLLSVPIASALFGIALLASGQNSTLTGTIAGQIVIEGFLNIRLPAWLRRLITRSVAIIPVIICLMLLGDSSITEMLVLSQVVLSMQLPFAVIPLVMFTDNSALMGRFANGILLKFFVWLIAIIIVVFNLILLYQVFSGSL